MRTLPALPLVLWLVIAPVAQGCVGSRCAQVVAAPATEIAAPTRPEHVSRLETTATVDLTAPLEAARAAVPAVFRTSDNAGVAWNGGNTDQGWLYLDGNFQPTAPHVAAYRTRAEVIRDHVDYSLSGTTIGVTGQFRYRVHAQGRIGPFFAGGYCGASNTASIPLTIRGQTTVGLTPSWTIESQSTLAVDRMDRCTITIAGIDVAPNLTAALQQVLNTAVLAGIANRIDQQLRSIDARGPVERAWTEFQRPFGAGGLHFALHPEALVLGALAASGSSTVSPPHAEFSAAIGVIARPTVTASEPEVTSQPLPDARPDAGGGLFVEASVELSYGEIDQALASLRGQHLAIAGGSVEIRQLALRAAGSGRLAIDVDFAGTGDHGFCGTATLVGTPAIDVPRQSVRFPDLDFTATTNSTLLDAYVWLEQARLRELVRDRLHLTWAAALPPLEANLVSAAAAKHVALTIDQREVAGVELGATARVVMVLSGAAKVDPIVIH